MPTKLPFLLGDTGPHLIHDFLVPVESMSIYGTSISSAVLCGSWLWPDTQTHRHLQHLCTLAWRRNQECIELRVQWTDYAGLHLAHWSSVHAFWHFICFACLVCYIYIFPCLRWSSQTPVPVQFSLVLVTWTRLKFNTAPPWSSRSGVATLGTAIHLLLTYLLLEMSPFPWTEPPTSV